MELNEESKWLVKIRQKVNHASRLYVSACYRISAQPQYGVSPVCYRTDSTPRGLLKLGMSTFDESNEVVAVAGDLNAKPSTAGSSVEKYRGRLACQSEMVIRRFRAQFHWAVLL